MAETTFVVWVMVVWIGGTQGAPIVVDDINSEANCRALAAQVLAVKPDITGAKVSCVAVRKIR